MMLAAFDSSLGFMLAAFITLVITATLVRYMPEWGKRWAFLSAICGAAIAIMLLLQAMR